MRGLLQFQGFRFHHLLFIGVLVLYMVFALREAWLLYRGAPHPEIFPFSTGALFVHVPSRVVAYELRFCEISDKPCRERDLEQWVEKEGLGGLVSYPHFVHHFGRSVENLDKTEVEGYIRFVRRNYLTELQAFELRIYQITYNPIEYWKNAKIEHRKLLEAWSIKGSKDETL